MASARLVGLDSGRMIGRSTAAAMAVTVASSKAPGTVEVPMRMVGCVWRTTSSRSITPPAASRRQPPASAAGRA